LYGSEAGGRQVATLLIICANCLPVKENALSTRERRRRKLTPA
jgi:hypothetical protein